MSHFFREGDIILTEIGTTSHGCREFIHPTNAVCLKPVTWLSIGYMLPATKGAAMTERDHCIIEHTIPRRTSLFEGDGSFQVTGQEVSTIIRRKLDTIIFLTNNGRYTIERMIRGKDVSYSGVAGSKYLSAGHFFGADNKASHKVCNWTVSTWGELEAALVHPDLKYGTGL